MSNSIKNKYFFPAKDTAKRVEKASYRLENVSKRYLTKGLYPKYTNFNSKKTPQF